MGESRGGWEVSKAELGKALRDQWGQNGETGNLKGY